MTLTLQFGYGMMAHSRELIERWGGGSVVLSPRDLTDDQLARTGMSVLAAGGEVLVDPQCYLRSADHDRLTNHAYFASYQAHTTGALLGGSGTRAFLNHVESLNQAVGATRRIIPGLYAESVDSDWEDLQSALIDEALLVFPSGSAWATIALSADALRDEAQVIACLDAAEDWNVDGFYVVLETPGSYLVDEPSWVTNALLLIAGLRLLKKGVLLGYSNHQMLIASCAGGVELASGTWLNVRAFSPEKFLNPAEGSIARRATWYYCPQAFSEFKLPFMDIAMRQGVLDRMAPTAGLSSEYCDVLFGGGTPTATGWSEQYAFRHYLTVLRQQALSLAGLGSFSATRSAYEAMLDTAESQIEDLNRYGVRGSQRSFADCIDVNRAALAVLASTFGARFRSEWPG